MKHSRPKKSRMVMSIRGGRLKFFLVPIAEVGNHFWTLINDHIAHTKSWGRPGWSVFSRIGYAMQRTDGIGPISAMTERITWGYILRGLLKLAVLIIVCLLLIAMVVVGLLSAFDLV